MKRYIAILLILFLVGCTQQATQIPVDTSQPAAAQEDTATDIGLGDLNSIESDLEDPGLDNLSAELDGLEII